MEKEYLPVLKDIRHIKLISKTLMDDGTFPNNNKLPVIIYEEALALPAGNEAETVEEIIRNNSWENTWRNGVYGFHHYHSTAHEVLVVYSGQATILLGGEKGLHVEIKKGDVLIIPAGVAHNNILSDDDFKVIGGYPKGQDWDMNYGKPGERPGTDKNIAHVPLPVADPVYGINGPVMEYWKIISSEN